LAKKRDIVLGLQNWFGVVAVVSLLKALTHADPAPAHPPCLRLCLPFFHSPFALCVSTQRKWQQYFSFSLFFFKTASGA